MLSGEYNFIPVCMEFHADMETPISIFKKIGCGADSFLLESIEGGEKWARYSFIGSNPCLVMESYGADTVLTYRDGGSTGRTGSPFEIARSLFGMYRSPKLAGMPRFTGGAVGFFGYDTVRFNERLDCLPSDDLNLPDCRLLFIDELIVFDHLKQKITIIVNIDAPDRYDAAIKRIDAIYEQLRQKTINPVKRIRICRDNACAGAQPVSFESNTTKDRYCSNVEKALEYIKNGDIFQVVLSMRLMTDTECDAFLVYRMLRTINPSPYMYFLKFNDFTIAGSSPEMLVRVTDGAVETRPIAGTRKRGRTAEEDAALEKELLSDSKEIAEHSMLVDLARNDIGKISKYGSVNVDNGFYVERYSHVMHIVSNVAGVLQDGRDTIDALISTLPAGTLSGAPKPRAMEIVNELESTKRGPYGGAICYFDFSGNLDSCITIRTLLFKDGKAYIQAGAGIVADSSPDNEYNECINKAGALLKSIEEAERIDDHND